MNTRTPKYMLIKNEFVQKIESGYYRPGDLIPSDNELMRTLNVSKSTITQALKCLEAEGYIIRQQGKGTFVADRSKDKINLSIYLCPMEDNEKHFWISLIEQFNLTSSGFFVTPTFLTNDKAPLRDSLLQSFTSGNAPDILSLDGPDVPYWAYMNSLLPFDGYMDSSFLSSFLSPIVTQEPIRENYIIWVIRNPLYVFCITKSCSIPLVSAFRLLRKMPGAGMSF